VPTSHWPICNQMHCGSCADDSLRISMECQDLSQDGRNVCSTTPVQYMVVFFCGARCTHHLDLLSAHTWISDRIASLRIGRMSMVCVLSPRPVSLLCLSAFYFCNAVSRVGGRSSQLMFCFAFSAFSSRHFVFALLLRSFTVEYT
jgi:hypothetical protein